MGALVTNMVNFQRIANSCCHCSMSTPQCHTASSSPWHCHCRQSLSSPPSLCNCSIAVNVTMPRCLEFAMALPLQAVSLEFAITLPLQYRHQCHTATLPHCHAGIPSENRTDQHIHHIVRLPTHLSDNPSEDTEPIADQ
jgi:hypothetical protein